MKHVTKFQKSIFVSLAVLGFVGGMQMSDIINRVTNQQSQRLKQHPCAGANKESMESGICSITTDITKQDSNGFPNNAKQFTMHVTDKCNTVNKESTVTGTSLITLPVL